MLVGGGDRNLDFHGLNGLRLAAGGWLDSLGYPFARGRIFDTVEKDNGQYDQTVEVFWASGCCFWA